MSDIVFKTCVTEMGLLDFHKMTANVKEMIF